MIRKRGTMNGKKKIIAVAAHKEYRMPSDPIYRPVFVGAALNPDGASKMAEKGWDRDDLGDQISEKNPGYCELTALYRVWKNTDADYIGLVHYRRHFTAERKRKASFEAVLSDAELTEILKDADLIVPDKRHYMIETLYSHYAMTHYARHLDLTRAEIRKTCPDYLPSFDAAVKQRSGYMFNMIIARRDLLDAYLSWLFPLLAGLERDLKDDSETEGLSAYQGRLYGRVSEILLNVWIDYAVRNSIVDRNRIRELPYMNMEGTNWTRKIFAFLRAKLFRKKYTGSF